MIIRNGMVIDGTGRDWFHANLIISNGVITNVCQAGRTEISGADVIDADGLVVAPGFIDCHTHSDLQLLADPYASTKIVQGVTTEIVGNCGLSVAPIGGLGRSDGCEMREYIYSIMGDPGVEWRWHTLQEYFRALMRRGTAVNVGTLVGHCSLRASVVGFEDRRASRRELDLMKDTLRSCMIDGAFGMSTGMNYIPGCFAPKDEFVELLGVVHEYGGIHATHLRNQAWDLDVCIREAAELAGRTATRLHVSHMLVAGRENWGKSCGIIDLLNHYGELGISITCDLYPYLAGSTGILTLLPPWSLSGGVEMTIQRLSDATIRERIRKSFREVHTWSNLGSIAGWENIVVTSTTNPANRNLVGKTVLDISTERRTDPVDTVIDIALEERGRATIINIQLCEEDVENFMAWRGTCFGTDAVYCGGRPHPRAYGTYPRVLGRYVRERKVLGLTEAIYKMTGLPAMIFGLRDIGTIKSGRKADLVVFDPDAVIDLATFQDPRQSPMGIRHVLVSGTPVVRDGCVTGALPGRILRAPHA